MLGTNVIISPMERFLLPVPSRGGISMLGRFLQSRLAPLRYRSSNNRAALQGQYSRHRMLIPLRSRGRVDAMAVVPDGPGRNLVVRMLMEEAETVTPGEVASAVGAARVSFLQRRQRDLRQAIAEAERRDNSPEVTTLTAEKLTIRSDSSRCERLMGVRADATLSRTLSE